MLGRKHGGPGIAAFGPSVFYREHVQHLHLLSGPQTAMGVVVAAGTALAPDLNENRSLGGRANPVWLLPVFGGHRTRTHILLAAVAVTAVTLLCERDVLAPAVVVGFMACMGSAVASVPVPPHRSVPLRSVRGARGVPVLPLRPRRLVAHRRRPAPPASRTSSPTPPPREGCRWLMPFTKRDFILGLMKTGHFLEQMFFTPLFVVLAAIACWAAFRPTVRVPCAPGTDDSCPSALKKDCCAAKQGRPGPSSDPRLSAGVSMRRPQRPQKTLEEGGANTNCLQFLRPRRAPGGSPP